MTIENDRKPDGSMSIGQIAIWTVAGIAGLAVVAYLLGVF